MADIRTTSTTNVTEYDESGNAIASAGSSSVANVSSSASNVTISASNANRKALYVYNDSTADLYLKFGATASVTSFTVLVRAGSFYEMPTRPIYTGILDGIWASANGAARVTELT